MKHVGFKEQEVFKIVKPDPLVRIHYTQTREFLKYARYAYHDVQARISRFTRSASRRLSICACPNLKDDS